MLGSRFYTTLLNWVLSAFFGPQVSLNGYVATGGTGRWSCRLHGNLCSCVNDLCPVTFVDEGLSVARLDQCTHMRMIHE